MHHRTVDKVSVEARAASFAKRSIKGDAKLLGLHRVISMIDLTTLEGKDSPEKINAICAKALQPDSFLDTPRVAAVCVYPSWVQDVKRMVGDSDIKVASVATGFPSGQIPLSLRINEVERAISEGADEIDMVITRGRFLSGDFDYISEEISAFKEACGSAHLKVILETGELGTYDAVRHASILAIEAGADFIKTSTGKVSPAATLAVTLVMLECIRDYYLSTGRKIGMKPAGGISSAKLALSYLVMVKETLGDAWLNSDLFRFGASSLLNDVLLQCHKINNGGNYSAQYDVTAS